MGLPMDSVTENEANKDSDDGFMLNISSVPLQLKPRPKKTANAPLVREEKKISKQNFGLAKQTDYKQQRSRVGEYDSGFDALPSALNTSSLHDTTDQKFENSELNISPRKNNNDSFGKFRNSTGSKPKGRRPTDFQNAKRSDQESGMRDGKKMHLSSLFASNPEVPHISPSNFPGKKELLFSSQMFDNLNLHPHLVSCLQARFNVTKVTEVQGRTIPALLKGKDALVKSCTGSGKTISYAVPIVQKLQEIRPKIQRSDGIYGLVILPTRELALQSFECFSNLTKAFTWIVPGYLIGGEKKKSEKARIRKGINILVCTPGRLLDHLEHTSNLNLKLIHWLVIDEADRLLEQGFEESVLKIMAHCSSTQESPRQTVLLSATLSKEVEKLAGMSLKDPEYIDIANVNATMEDFTVPSQLKQHVIFTPTKLRLVTLSAFMVQKCSEGNFKALVFMCTQTSVDFHFTLFNQMLKPMVKVKGHRIKFLKLHGNMKQEDRTEIFNVFKASQSGILLCTDVASRGLDLPHVDWILQYSTPTSVENYVHRVGRTARIGQEGRSLLFLIPSEIGFTHLLQKHGISMEELMVKDILCSLLLIADVINESSKQRWNMKPIEEHATALQFKYEELVYSDTDVYNIAKEAFLSFVQAYSSYPKPLRRIIPFKMLHLGHVAKSFCLRESPSELGCKFSKPPPRRQEERSSFSSFRPGIKRKQMTEISEFDSGLSLLKTENMPAKKKRKMRN